MKHMPASPKALKDLFALFDDTIQRLLAAK